MKIFYLISLGLFGLWVARYVYWNKNKNLQKNIIRENVNFSVFFNVKGKSIDADEAVGLTVEEAIKLIRQHPTKSEFKSNYIGFINPQNETL